MFPLNSTTSWGKPCSIIGVGIVLWWTVLSWFYYMSGPKPKVVDHPVVTTSADVVPLTAD
jgi:hypothetical protein